MIIDFPEQVYAIVNKPVYLHCNAKGYPLATFRWSKDNWQNLASDDQYKIFENGTLMINSIQKKNKGEYKCEARNSYGHDEKTLVLKVQGICLLSFHLKDTFTLFSLSHSVQALCTLA